MTRKPTCLPKTIRAAGRIRADLGTAGTVVGGKGGGTYSAATTGEEIPRRIAAEKQTALAEATQQVTERYEQQILVLQKDAEAERKVATLQVAALQETLKR